MEYKRQGGEKEMKPKCLHTYLQSGRPMLNVMLDTALTVPQTPYLLWERCRLLVVQVKHTWSCKNNITKNGPK